MCKRSKYCTEQLQRFSQSLVDGCQIFPSAFGIVRESDNPSKRLELEETLRSSLEDLEYHLATADEQFLGGDVHYPVIMVVVTSVRSNLAKGRIAVLSPLAAANGFVRS